tara:strand:+ start:113 stop:508 length:396 start_codon:yes stop_codon:yes gene_type:complete
MSLIVDCKFCGERISLRKMPHGKFVPFDADTDDQHKCTKSDTKKVSKKQIKDKKTITPEQPRKASETVENYVAEDDNVINNSNTKEENFQNDTLESLKNEIEIEVKEKKDNKILFLAAIAAVVIIIIFLNS